MSYADDVYGGTQRYFRQIVHPTYGIEFDFTDMNDVRTLENFVHPGKTKLVWIESPTNPTLKVMDIQAVAEFTTKHKLLLVVDNTFMSPYFQNLLTLGADLVVHSGLKTLHVRMATHASNAQAVAEYLEAHPAVEKVLYPGLHSHPQHEIAKKQAHGFGGMVTFYLRGGLEQARAFLEKLEIFTLAESLGAVESLAESPAIMTHASVPAEIRKELGISDNLVRLSVGIEGLPDLIADLERALDAVKAL